MNFILILRILMVYNSTFMNFCHCLSIHFNFAPNILIIPDVGPTNLLAIGHSQSDIWHFPTSLSLGWAMVDFIILFASFVSFIASFFLTSLYFLWVTVLAFYFAFYVFLFPFSFFWLPFRFLLTVFLQLWLWPLNYFWYLFNVRCALYGLEMYIFIWLMACLAL